MVFILYCTTSYKHFYNLHLLLECIVSESTISRELKRNGRKRGYSSKQATMLANERKERMPGNRAIKTDVKDRALTLLKTEQWSPQQISGYLKMNGVKISHETIYGMIRRDKLDGGDLYKNCRHRLKHRKRPVGTSVRIPNRVSIHDRPEWCNALNFGNWEMDTIVGRNNKEAIVTLVERSTNYLIMKKLKYGKNAKELSKTVSLLLMPFKSTIQSITTDNGSEFADHQTITKKLSGVKIYFADPYSSWQKGAIENTNKLIRQYIPKGTDINTLTDAYIADIQYKINKRPRKKLNFLSPKQVFYKHFS